MRRGWLWAGTLLAGLLADRAALADCDAWRLSPYPDGHDFAFTIVHDADSASSRRLAPVMESFDAVGMRITVTVFAFWAAGTSDSVWGVPLIEPSEAAFYRDLEARGHEIGLHTASETSDTREETQRAFALFALLFGHPLRIYVEHSAANNQEALARDGANPASPYHVADLLARSGAWIWLDDPSGLPGNHDERYYDLLAAHGSPFDESARARYGIERAFMRSGRWREADGDGFLAHYSNAHIDALARGRGVALVYTHLQRGWLDPATGRTRSVIVDRLRYLAEKDGWFVPAGTILDRFRAMADVSLVCDGARVDVVNRGGVALAGVTLLGQAGARLRGGGELLTANRDGEIVVGTVPGGGMLSLVVP